MNWDHPFKSDQSVSPNDIPLFEREKLFAVRHPICDEHSDGTTFGRANPVRDIDGRQIATAKGACDQEKLPNCYQGPYS